MKVGLVNPHISKRFIAQNHYAVRSPSTIVVHLGLFDGDVLKGICQLGYGVRPYHTIKRLFPSLGTEDYFEICRLCLLDALPHNSESQFLKDCILFVKRNFPDRKLLFTWADGLRGKPGFIYQASNFLCGGYIWSEFYATQEGEVVHPRLLITRYGSRSRSITEQLGLTKYWGMQIRYVKFLCSHKEHKRLIAESPFEWTTDYIKLKDLRWQRQAGEGSRESCQLPKLKGLGQFQQPAPILELLKVECLR